MTDPAERCSDAAALQKLAPLDRGDALALIAALAGECSIRELADVIHRLTGAEWGPVCLDVVNVLAGQVEVDAADVAQMWTTALSAGWRPTSRTPGAGG